MFDKNDISIIVLSGGKSSRMKTDKGFVLIDGKPMIQHILDTLKKVSDNVIIIANDDKYKTLGFPCYADIIPDCGPIGGIYTGLVHTDSRKNLILSCDIPLVSAAFLTQLISKVATEDVLVPEHNGKTEPLCAVYDKRCMEVLKERIENGELKMMDALLQLNTVYFKMDSNEWNAVHLFTNINTPDELIENEKKVK